MKSMTAGAIAKPDSKYPSLLKNIPGAPKKLFYKGNWDKNIFENCLAVVGSRHLTSYGKRVADQLVGEIAANGITIVSGFMYGGDAAAHKAALDAGGKTIAVMPCGIENIHPSYQKELYQRILSGGGLVISEYEGNQSPQNWMYPQRNRIVAGLSQAILVLEAGLESGTLITADLAKKFGRKIFSVPGQLFCDVSQGALKLIKEGAFLVTSAKDITNFYNLKRSLENKKKLIRTDDAFEQKIFDLLCNEPQDSDNLSRKMKMRMAELGSKLSIMQIKGIIKLEGEKYYVD
jgi:DNA processing protein